MTSGGSCKINQIFLGEIASVQNYGAFVRIPGCKQQGLIHKTQVSSGRVDDVADVLRRGERVWCKVIDIDDSGKVGLSMKHVNQGNGRDLDPNGVEKLLDDKRRKKFVPGQKREAIRLEAVLDATCTKCGTRGHLRSDCFVPPDGKKYDLLPETDNQPVVENMRTSDTSIRKEKTSTCVKRKRKSELSVHSNSSDENDDNDNGDDTSEHGRKRKKKSSTESEMRRKKKKKDKKKRKKKEKKRGVARSDSDLSESGGETSDKKSKKCKHSRSKYSD